MADTTGVLARLQAALSTYDPTWDVSVGSATYKILESVANEIANANNNSTLQTYSYDINTKSGNDLDTFCNLFGVYRQLGKRAVGLATFTTNTPTTSIINIPIGTQVAVPVSATYTTPVYFSTTAPAIIPIGSTTVSVPVLASLPGIYGNVPGNTITNLATSLIGITSVTNLSPMTGGADPESDSQFRARWQATAFNNTTGTNGKYITTAYQDPNVTTANAIGAQNFYDEQLNVQATISGGSSGVTFQLVAYNGMTNVITGNTYSGTTVVAYSGFPSSATGATVASGLQALVSGIAPFSYIGVSAAPSGNTIASGLNISFGGPSPYRLTIGSGNSINTTSVSGAVTISGATYIEYVRSLNPDIGASGTQSYNGTFSGFLYPQGNELVGTNLNSASEIVYAPNSDYYYNSNGTYTVSGTYSPQLYLQIANPSDAPELFIGNTVEVISEYNPAASRVTTAASGNFVDIFINATTPATASEQTVFNPSNILTSGNPVPYLNTVNYVLGNGKVAATNASVSGDIYVPFDRQPLINFPSQLSTSSSGMSDMVVLYNDVISSGITYGITVDKYPYISFTGSCVPVPYTYIDVSGNTINGQTISGVNFLYVNNANNFLYPGLALANDGVVLSGQPYHIMQVTSSGVMLNQMVNNSGTNVVFSGKSLVYPIYDTTDNSNSVKSMTGLAFDHTASPSGYGGWPALPNTGNSWVLYNHDYNGDVVDVEGLVQQSRPLGVNTLVHQASFQNLVINIRIVFTSGYSLTTVQANIANQLTQYFNNYNYLGIISFASLQSQILGVTGVANVRITSVSTVAIDGTPINTYSSDFVLASNQLPALYNVVYNITGASTF